MNVLAKSQKSMFGQPGDYKIPPAAFYKLAGFTFIEASYLNYFCEVSLDFSEILKCIWEIKH